MCNAKFEENQVEKQSGAIQAAYEGQLRQFYMARRKLEPHFTPEGKPIREDLMKLYQVKSTVDSARRRQEQTQTKRQERDMER